MERRIDMYVCLCNAVRESELREVIEVSRCSSIREVRQHTDIGDKCGSCLPQVEDILHGQKKKLLQEPEHNPCCKCGKDCFDYRAMWEEAGHMCSRCLIESWDGKKDMTLEQKCYVLMMQEK